MAIKNGPIKIQEPGIIFNEAEAFLKASYTINKIAGNEAVRNKIDSSIQMVYADFVLAP